MGLIHQNRDYVTRDRTARINLALHSQIMKEKIEQGTEKNEASKQAFKELLAIPYKKRAALIKR